jgi:hypothetical protein
MYSYAFRRIKCEKCHLVARISEIFLCSDLVYTSRPYLKELSFLHFETERVQDHFAT